MDVYEQMIARLRTRFSGVELEGRIRTVRARQAATRDKNDRFDTAMAQIRQDLPEPAPDALPFERQFLESLARLKASLHAGLSTPQEYEERLARITALRDERAAQWHAQDVRQARTTYRRMDPRDKVLARLFFRSVRARQPRMNLEVS